MAKKEKQVDDFVVGLELLRSFKRIKAFAQINIESLNKKLLEKEAMYEDAKRLRAALGQVEELLELVDET
jgi:hypothetical protein